MKPFVVASIVGSVVIAGGVLLTGNFLGARGIAGGNSLDNAALQQTAAGRAAALETVALEVGNLFCVTCPYIVKRALEGTTGVISADVSFREKRARVTYDPSRVEVAALIKATTEMGYPSRLAGD
jgi:mercuric ion binding protein